MRVQRQTSSVAAFVGWLISFAFVVLLGIIPAYGWVTALAKIETDRPTTYWVQSVAVEAKPDLLPVVLGRQDFGQRAGPDSASSSHLLVTREDARWWLQNVAEDRRVLLVYENPNGVEQEYLMRRFPLRKGDKITSGTGPSLQIADLKSPRRMVKLIYERANDTTHVPVTYDVTHQNGYGVAVSTGSDAKDAAKAGWLGAEGCRSRRSSEEVSFSDIIEIVYDNRIQRFLAVGFDRAIQGLGQYFPSLASEDPSRRLIRLGGYISCEDRIAFPAVDRGALWIDLRDDALFLGGTPAAFDAIKIERDGEDVVNLADYRWPVKGVHPHFGSDLGTLTGVYLGRTKYAVELGNQLSFEAVSKVQKFLDVPEDTMPDSFMLAELDCMTGRATKGSACEDGLPPPSETRDGVRTVAFGVDMHGTESADPLALNWGFLLGEFNFLLAFALPIWVSLMAFGSIASFGLSGLARNSLVQCVSLGTLKKQSEPTATWFVRGAEVFVRLMIVFLCPKLLSDLVGPDPSTERMILILVSVWGMMTLLFAIEIARLGARGHWLSVLAGGGFWATLGALIATGSITMHLLGTGSANSAWDSFGSDHHAGLMVLFAGLALFLGVPNQYWRAAVDYIFISTRRGGRFCRGGLAVVVLLIACVMFAVGSEEGLLGLIQPSEINKFALIVVLGTLFVSFERDSRYNRTSKNEAMSIMTWIMLAVLVVATAWGINPRFQLIASAAGLMAILYFVPKVPFIWLGLFALASFVGVPAALQDFSPIVISVFLVGLILTFGFFQSQELGAFRVAAAGGNVSEPYEPKLRSRMVREHSTESSAIGPMRRGLRVQAIRVLLKRNKPNVLAFLGLFLVVAVFLATVLFARYVGTEIARGDRILELDSIQRRFAVYLDRETYVEWGDQLRRAWAVLGYNPELSCGFPYMSCLRDIRQSVEPLNAVEIMSVPAIQDDLISAFFIARFGSASMVVLVACQIVFMALGMLGVLLVFRRIPGNIQDETSRLFLSITAFGAVCLFVIHWCISWANLMGWAPIMGQPMTFISYARSHMLGMGFPALVSILLVLRLGPPTHIRQW